MASIGDALRRERLRLGLELGQIAEETKIGTRFLQAMEADDFEKLPGGVFSRSFLKQYACALGLDEEAISSEYKTIQLRNEESPPAPQGFVSQSHVASVVPAKAGWRLSELQPRSKSMLVSAGWVVLAIGAGLWAYFFLNHAPSPSAAAAPDRVVETQAPPVPPKPEPIKRAPADAPAPLPTSMSPVQVLLKTTEKSWISVFADNRNKFTGVLEPNESKQINADERVKVIAGNSGALDILLNGKSIGPIGRTGQRGTVELTPLGAHVVRRTSAASPDALPDPLL